MDLDKEIFGPDAEEALPPEFESFTAEAIGQRGRLLDNEIRVLKVKESSCTCTVQHEPKPHGLTFTACMTSPDVLLLSACACPFFPQDDSTRLALEQNALKGRIKENKEKIKLNNQLPYLVSNIVEVLDIKPDEVSQHGGCIRL